MRSKTRTKPTTFLGKSVNTRTKKRSIFSRRRRGDMFNRRGKSIFNSSPLRSYGSASKKKY